MDGRFRGRPTWHFSSCFGSAPFAVAGGFGAVAAAFHRAPAAAPGPRVVDEHQRAGWVGAVLDPWQLVACHECDPVLCELCERGATGVGSDEGEAERGVELRTRCRS